MFDSNILIDYLNGVPMAQIEVDTYESRAISIMTWMEIMVGSNPQTETDTRIFLTKFQSLPLTQTVADRAVILSQKHRIKLPDAIIAATAEVTGRVLITRNTKDFGYSSVNIRIPYRL